MIAINLSAKPQTLAMPALPKSQKWLSLVNNNSSIHIDKGVLNYALEGKTFIALSAIDKSLKPKVQLIARPERF